MESCVLRTISINACGEKIKKGRVAIRGAIYFFAAGV